MRRVADIAAFEAAENPDEGIVDSNPYAVLATHGKRYVVDAGGNTLLHVRHGVITTVAVLPSRPNPLFPAVGPPMFESVPDSIVRGPRGDLFVGELTGFPFLVGMANVYRVARDGDFEVYASGFTNIIDIAFDHKGNLYVLEFATNGLLSGPPGALWRVARGGGTKSESTMIEVEGLTLHDPAGLAIGRGAIYVSNHGTSAGDGEVVRIPLNSHGHDEEEEEEDDD